MGDSLTCGGGETEATRGKWLDIGMYTCNPTTGEESCKFKASLAHLTRKTLSQKSRNGREGRREDREEEKRWE